MRACPGRNVSKMMRGPDVSTDAWVADAAVLNMALSKDTADNHVPWTWAQNMATTAAEAAGSGLGMGIDSLGSMAAAAEDEGKACREHCAQVAHWEVV